MFILLHLNETKQKTKKIGAEWCEHAAGLDQSRKHFNFATEAKKNIAHQR